MTPVFLVAHALLAFVCTRTDVAGPSLYWQSRDVEMQISGEADEVAQADLILVTQQAADAWSAVDCSDVAPVLGGDVRTRIVGFDWEEGRDSDDNANIVVFRHGKPKDALDAWVHELGALAITTVTFDSGTGELFDADIEVNDDNFTFSVCDPGTASCEVNFDLRSTLTHEMGHVLGLDHPDVPDATMFASAPIGEIQKRDLAADDIAGVCTIYPVGGAAENCYDAPRVVSPSVSFHAASCSAGPNEAPFALGVWLMIRLAVRQRARRSGF